MSLMNEIHRNNQINVKQLIILFNTIKRVIFPASTLSCWQHLMKLVSTYTRPFVSSHAPLKLVIQLFLFYSLPDAEKTFS
jgi:hypothetical protein